MAASKGVNTDAARTSDIIMRDNISSLNNKQRRAMKMFLLQ